MSLFNDHNLPGQIMLAEGSLERAISEGEALTEMRNHARPEDSVRSLYRNPWGRLQGAGGGWLFFAPTRIAPTRGPLPDLRDPPSMPEALMGELAKVDACEFLKLSPVGYLALSEAELVRRINFAAGSRLELRNDPEHGWGWWSVEDEIWKDNEV